MKTLTASELMNALKERKADFTYAEPEPRLEPAMPAGGQE